MQILTAVVSLAPRLRKPWPIARSLSIVLAVTAVAGCSNWQLRQGLKPIVDGAEVEAASANKLVLLRALAQDASIGGERASDWYLISEAGFNFIDDQCRAYFDELFFLNRRKDGIKTGLTVADKTTSAILAATGATNPTMGIVAQAFGLGIHAVDLIAGTYLYQLPPATTQGFVSKLQLRFRQEAALARGAINSPTIAYYMIQRYLDLCLPPRIEAEINKQINATTAVGVPGGPGAEALFSLETVSSPPPEALRPPVIAPVVRERVIVRADDPLVKQKQLTDEVQKNLDRQFIGEAQVALCAPQTGTFDPDMQKAVTDYLRTKEKAAPLSFSLKNRPLKAQLEHAVANVPNCKAAGFLNAFEVGTFGPSDGLAPSSRAEDQRSKITNMQRRLVGALTEAQLQLPVTVTGDMSDQTRTAIGELNVKLGFKTAGDSTRREINRQLNDKLIRVRVLPPPATPSPPPNTAPATPPAAPPR